MSILSHTGILYEGPSPIDGAPIVAIVTGGSSNAKTGPMLQVWILRADMAPHDAKKSGLDVSVCGHCPNRSACYVQVHQAPLSVWKAYKRGSYEHIEPEQLAGHAIRWGAYGDPALIPFELVARANLVASRWTGYTHQWAKPWGKAFRGIFMASIETQAQETKLSALGWSTFRAGMRDKSDQGSAVECASDRLGLSCLACGACNGRGGAIFIAAHGARAASIPAEMLAKKAKRALSLVD